MGSNAVFHFDCLAESRIAYFWVTVRERAELGPFRPHDLRRNYASFAARSSETLPMIGKLLGHARVGTTQRYAHLVDETLLAAVERVGASYESSEINGHSRKRHAASARSIRFHRKKR